MGACVITLFNYNIYLSVFACVVEADRKWKANFAGAVDIDTNWTLLTSVWSREEGLHLYRDGCLISHGDAEDRRSVYSTSSVQYFRIGTASGENSAGANQMQQELDELKMWYRELSPSEVWHMYRQAPK